MCDNSTGFCMGQNIVAWVNCLNGGIYAQNIGPDGTIGIIEPPVITCLAPENFEGEYIYNMEEEQFGVMLKWDAPETQPLHYNLYRSDFSTKEEIIIEVAGDATSYYDESGVGQYKYQLTAVYENCESEFTLTPNGEDYVIIYVTGIQENTMDEIDAIVRIYNANGQCLNAKTTDELSTGIYILQGLTKDGRLVSKKIVVEK